MFTCVGGEEGREETSLVSKKAEIVVCFWD